MPSFDLYEYVGYIVPGSVLLIALMPFCPWVREQFTLGTAANVGIFLIATFLLGHSLHTAAHMFETTFLSECEGGVAGQNLAVTHPNRLFSAAEETDFRAKFEPHFKIKIDSLNKLHDKEKLLEWCNAILRIQDDVRDRSRGKLLDTFIKDYGLYLGLTAAFSLAFLFCLFLVIINSIPRNRRKRTLVLPFTKIRIATPFRQIIIVFIIAAIGTALSVWRLLYFGRLFARELFLSFLAL